MTAAHYFRLKGTIPFGRCNAIFFGDQAEQEAKTYISQTGGHTGSVYPAMVYRVETPTTVTELGPGFAVLKRPPKYKIVVEAGSLFAELV